MGKDYEMSGDYLFKKDFERLLNKAESDNEVRILNKYFYKGIAAGQRTKTPEGRERILNRLAKKARKAKRKFRKGIPAHLKRISTK